MPSLNDSVQPIEGERMCYQVRSDTNPKRAPYRVDLLYGGGFGRCSCADWETRRWPAIRDGKGEPGSRAVLCKHLIRARRMFLNGLLKHMAVEEGSIEL